MDPCRENKGCLYVRACVRSAARGSHFTNVQEGAEILSDMCNQH